MFFNSFYSPLPWSTENAKPVTCTAEELAAARQAAAAGTVYGIPDSSEHITLAVRTVAEILADERVDWSVVGMLAAALSRGA